MFGRRKDPHEIDPDEIFLDARNSPQFNDQQFEGRLERPIGRMALVFLGSLFLLVLSVFSGRLAFLQVAHGDEYNRKSEENRLEAIPLFGIRGVIYDRNKKLLAWNEEGENAFFERDYLPLNGLSHLLGYVGHPKKDDSGIYWQKEIFGRDGLELEYDSRLKGENGEKLVETDATGNVTSESLQRVPVNGENLTLAIDARLQEKLYGQIVALAAQVGFTSGAGIMMDVETGEVVALASYPEYDSRLLSNGGDRAKINALLNDARKPFLNRAVAGLYTPGSIVKPYFALAALQEGIISPDKKLLSTGSISIPNPYFPDKESVFKDWKAHGWVDMRRAIAVSSDVYFYIVGGGFEDQKGLGIANLGTYAKLFGLGEPTGIDLPGETEGVVPSPEWKKEHFKGEAWFLGNTYHTAIGQYGFQVTPIQMTRAVASIANDGWLVTPRLVLGEAGDRVELPVQKEFFKVAKEGMRAGVVEGGTAAGLSVPYVKVAGKTGTAELGVAKDKVNSWVTGFFPYDEPKYAFAVVMERGPKGNTLGATYVMRGFLDWMVANTPEYLK
ncbi:MAG: penicillin-binding transpeptidase domain-containing protein [bacterium]|nr:penicillin-binding transpeptidase domain-containing protein [bacterium]